MKLLLIDGNSLLFRAYFATSYREMLKTSNGIYTNAIYAFANMLEKALKLIKPDYCAVAFDKGKHTFRHEMCPDYKGGRKQTPEELVMQFPIVREMMDAYNIPYLEFDEIEADDIIGTLSKKFDIETCILSSDRDLLQLIDNTTSVYIMKKGMSEIAKMDEKALLDEYELKPKQIIDFKGLAGDKSDNIKGVEGVGETTATKLLNQYDTCEGIYDHIDEIKGKLHDKLLKDKDSCFLSKKLATIKTDYKIDKDLDDLLLNINIKTRNDFFTKYEMISLVDNSVSKSDVKCKEVKAIDEQLLNNSLVYFISNELSYYEREYVGAIIINNLKAEFITIENVLKDKKLLSYLSSDKNKYVYDLKALKHGLDNYNISLGKNTNDLMIMTFLVDNNQNELRKIMNFNHVNFNPDLKLLFGSEKKPIKPSIQEIIDFNINIVSTLFNSVDKITNKLKKDDLTKLYEEVELPLVDVLYEMENEGIICDINELDKIAEDTLKHIGKIEKKIYKHVGHEFNINSPAQLKEVLYDELDLPDYKKGSTNAEVLVKIEDYHPVVAEVLEFRKYSKLYSTYAEGLKKFISKDGKIHTIFSQTITATGRLSSYDPNLQNISVRDENAKEIRKAFKASKGCYLLSSDYSQIELRVLASLANEPKMIKAFDSGDDIHTRTAKEVFGLKDKDVTPTDRRHAKAVNFGVVYGISDYGLANQTALSFKDAKKFIDDYFKTYPNIKTYLDSQVEFCIKHGYVKTMLNRRRYINEINDPKWQLKEFGKRAAMNSTIQGSAADLIKIAMINISNRLKKDKYKSKLILQVHDELIFDVKEDELEKISKMIHDEMINAYKLKVKLDVSMSHGKDWFETK